MATDDIFRTRLDQMIDPRHPLAVLASRMPKSQIEASQIGRAKLNADSVGEDSHLGR